MPLHPAFVLLLSVLLAGRVKGDETPKREATPTAEPAARSRLVSPRTAALLAAAMPKFEPLPVVEPQHNSAAASEGAAKTPDVGIVHLPSYIVRDRKVPLADEVDKGAVARRAMEHYLGPENGLDRGFLNLITAKQVPVLALFSSIPNEERALALYRADERRRKQAELAEFASYLRKPAYYAPSAAKPNSGASTAAPRE